MEPETPASVDLLRREIEILRAHVGELRRVFGGLNEDTKPQRETDYRDLVESARVMIYRVPTEDSEPAYFSPATESITGVAPSQMDRRRFLDMIYPEDRLRVLADFARLGADQRRLRSEYRLVRQDGSIVCLEDRASVVLDADGNRIAMVGVVLDLSDRGGAGTR